MERAKWNDDRARERPGPPRPRVVLHAGGGGGPRLILPAAPRAGAWPVRLGGGRALPHGQRSPLVSTAASRASLPQGWILPTQHPPACSSARSSPPRVPAATDPAPAPSLAPRGVTYVAKVPSRPAQPWLAPAPRPRQPRPPGLSDHLLQPPAAGADITTPGQGSQPAPDWGVAGRAVGRAVGRGGSVPRPAGWLVGAVWAGGWWFRHHSPSYYRGRQRHLKHSTNCLVASRVKWHLII